MHGPALQSSSVLQTRAVSSAAPSAQDEHLDVDFSQLGRPCRCLLGTMVNFPVNLASIEKKLPKTMTMPPLLRSFGQWVAKIPQGSLGYFEAMAGDKFVDDSLPLDANKEIAGATGVFMIFGEGSMVALWNHGEGPPAVVLIDSEGQHRTLAPTLEAFLEAWSKQKTGTELDGMDLDDDEPQRHKELARWLAEKKVRAERRKAPDFGRWIDTLVKSAAPPKAKELPGPPKDMAKLAMAAIGRPATDPKVNALLTALGIDFAKYKTADAQRHMLVPRHGYRLSFEKKKLVEVLFANQGLTRFDYVNGKDARFAAFPHEVLKGAKTTDTLDVIRRKVGKFDSEDVEWGAYRCELPGGAKLVVSCAVRGKKKGTVEYIMLS